MAQLKVYSGKLEHKLLEDGLPMRGFHRIANHWRWIFCSYGTP